SSATCHSPELGCPPMNDLLAAAVLGALVALWVASRAAITVCVLRVRAGKTVVVRGAVAPRILGDLADVLERPPVPRATVRIVRDAGFARLEIRGAIS